MPPVAGGPEVDEFVAGLKIRGRAAVCYPISAISAWLFGTGGRGGRPKELPASAFDPRNDRTMQLRHAAEATPDPKEKKRLLRQLSGQAKFAARLGFSSVSDYEDWIARGAPEDELPPECRPDAEPPVGDDPSSERLQIRSDAAIAKMRGVAPDVVTAERRRAEPPLPPQPEPWTSPEPKPPVPRAPSPWSSTPAPTDDDDDYVDPFALARRSAPRRSVRYWGR